MRDPGTNEPALGVRSFDLRVLVLLLAVSAPGFILAVVILARLDIPTDVRFVLAVVLATVWMLGVHAARNRIIRPVQTLANLLSALRQGDFSVRAVEARRDDSLGLALDEVNTLAETLREQRVGALEATALLRRVISEIDVAVLAFDGDRRLRLLNRAAERLAGLPAEEVLGRSAEELGIGECLEGSVPRTITPLLPNGVPEDRWELRRTTFRQGGRPHQLVVLTNLSRVLREEERQAWRRLIRVLSHEINNSLAPIQSIAGSLLDLLRDAPLSDDDLHDLNEGVRVIRDRSGALSRFMASYTRLARLPPPQPTSVDVGEWVQRMLPMESRVPVSLGGGEKACVRADPDQLDQLLLNLLRNAADAALETDGGVSVSWYVEGSEVELIVDDEGPGVGDTANLFVPFFTTKPNGTGIGLALCRQIADAHSGTLTLENRADHRGARARLRLPRADAAEDSPSAE